MKYGVMSVAKITNAGFGMRLFIKQERFIPTFLAIEKIRYFWIPNNCLSCSESHAFIRMTEELITDTYRLNNRW